MVKTAKQLFKACMNETEIEDDNLETIKQVLKTVGGWPVVEGFTWNETNFDWLQASYKLRELGYHFSSFLDIEIQFDPDNKGQYIFSVQPPNVWDRNTKMFKNISLMIDVALMFGAENVVKTAKEMIEVEDFFLEMQLYSYSPFYNSTVKQTVEKYQDEYNRFNWLEFINTMTRSTVNLTNTDFVVFPAIDVTTAWFRLLSKTPKRTQANYMMWKVIQEVFPYLTLELQKRTHTRNKKEDREEFCLRETENRFVPSPVGIIYDRRHLSHEKIIQVEEQILQIKSVLVDILNQTEWMGEDDKILTIEKVKAAYLVFGTPGNCSNDQILDDLDMDMMENTSETFLSLMAEATRNLRTIRYNNARKSVSETLAERWYIRDGADIPFYAAEDNIIYIPTVTLEGSLFYEQTPRYLNYGAIGYQLGGLIGEYTIWSNYSKEVFSAKLSCMRKELQDFQLSEGLMEIPLILTHSFGQQISYMAYEKWIESHGEEPNLSGLHYTPKQLFWLSVAETFCQPINTNNPLGELHKNPTYIANIVSASTRNIPEFAKDFDCPLGSKMNPPNRCNFIQSTEVKNRTIDL